MRIGLDSLAGVAPEYRDRGVDAALEGVVRTLARTGADVVSIELPLYDELTTADIVVMVSEAAAFHANEVRARWDDFTPGMRSLVATHGFHTGADYVQASSGPISRKGRNGAR